MNLKMVKNILSLISKKCKEQWDCLSNIEKSIYNKKELESKKNDDPPAYENIREEQSNLNFNRTESLEKETNFGDKS